MAEFKLKQTAEEVQMAVDNGLSFGEFTTGGDTLVIPAYSEEELMAKLESGEIVSVAAMGLAKISNAIVTMADLTNGCAYANGFSGAFDIPAEEITYQVDGVITLPENLALFVDESAVGVDNDGIVFPEPGVYFIVELLLADNALTIPGYTGFPVTKKIEQKYLPGAVILYADEENYLYATADTSDTSKRMTRAELTDAVYSGRMVYCFLDGAAYYALLNFVDAVEFAIANFDDGEGKQTFFTAEYVSE